METASVAILDLWAIEKLKDIRAQLVDVRNGL